MSSPAPTSTPQLSKAPTGVRGLDEITRGELAQNRRLRVVKYRGASHGTHECPVLIDEDGFSVMPLSGTAGTGRSSLAAEAACRRGERCLCYSFEESEAQVVRNMRSRGVTALFINLTGGGDATEATPQEVSSIIDAWLLLRDVELGGERNRVMYVLKIARLRAQGEVE